MGHLGALNRSVKEMNKEKLTMLDKIQEWWYNLWHYTWGFSHLRDLKYALKHLLWDRYDLIRTKLPKSKYHDSPILVLYGLMNLLVEFVEIEKCFDVIDFEDSTHWQEVGVTIREIYDWWKDYPNREKEISISLDNWHDSKFVGDYANFLDQINMSRDTEESKRYSKIHDVLEEKLKEEETEMLIKIVKIKDYLWT